MIYGIDKTALLLFKMIYYILRNIADYVFERQRVLNRIPDGDFMSVTTEDGRRLYMSVRTDEEMCLQVRGHKL